MNQYSIGIAVSILMCAAAFVLMNGKRRSADGILLTAGFSAAGGLLFARLVYWLGALDFFIGRTHSALSLFWWTDGGFSLFGAVLGAALCAWLCCRILKESSAMLDALSFPILLLIAEERLLEWTALGMNFGTAADSPVWLTIESEYGRKLNVALIEALLMVLIAVFLIVRMRRTGRRITLRDTLFMAGLCEVLMISMRRDSYMMWGFVHQEQLFFYLLSAALCIYAGIESKKPAVGVLGSLAVAGVIVFLEFALDGRVTVPFSFLRDWADPFWYILFILTLTGYYIFYIRLRGKAERDKTK